MNFMKQLGKYRKLRDITNYERKVYSQNGEDGIIEEIFKRIGTTNKFFVEFGIDGVEGGSEYNGRKLLEEGWNALLMDGGPHEHKSQVKHEYITAENINILFAKYNIPKEFDLLSIDIDSNDYWVWKSLNSDYKPRVVIIEYNAHIPPSEAKTVKYDPGLVWDGTDYFGASLRALYDLGKKKGYTLLGCESRGVNAFFLRNDNIESFKIKPLEDIYRPPGYGKFENGKWLGHPKSKRKMIYV